MTGVGEETVVGWELRQSGHTGPGESNGGGGKVSGARHDFKGRSNRDLYSIPYRVQNLINIVYIYICVCVCVCGDGTRRRIM